MAAPVVASSASGAVAADADATFAVAVPAGTTAGDLLFAALSCDGGRTMSGPAGWTTLGATGVGSARITLAAKIATSGDTSGSFTFTGNAGFNDCRGWVARITGATNDVANLVLDSGPGQSGSGSSATTSNVTSASADNLLLYGCAASNSASAAGSGGWNEEYDGASSAFTKALSVYSQAAAVAGSQAGPTVTITFTAWATLGVAIPSAGGGGGGAQDTPELYGRRWAAQLPAQ